MASRHEHMSYQRIGTDGGAPEISGSPERDFTDLGMAHGSTDFSSGSGFKTYSTEANSNNFASRENDNGNNTSSTNSHNVGTQNLGSSHGIGQGRRDSWQQSNLEANKTRHSAGKRKRSTTIAGFDDVAYQGVEMELKSNYQDTIVPEAASQIPARHLKRRATDIIHIVSWIIMVIFPVLFIVLGAYTAALEGRPSDSHEGVVVQEATIVAVTAWPITFAAILAQSLRAFASYRAERGLRLLTLEQLIKIDSVASALKAPFNSRRLEPVTICLILLWALSPLTNQALLRMLYVGPLGTMNNVTVSYLDTFQDPSTVQGVATWDPEVDVLYGASLVQPTAAGEAASDLWGNVRIPMLTNITSAASNGGWYDVPVNQTDVSFYSLLGMPMTGLNGSNFSASFTMTSAYLNLECSPFQNVSSISVINGSGTAWASDQFGGFNLGVKLVNVSNLHYVSTIMLGSRYLDPNGSAATVFENTNCSLSRAFISSQVLCNPSCAVTGIQPANVTGGSTNAVPTGNITAPLNASAPASLTNPVPLNSISLQNLLFHLTANDPLTDSGGYTASQKFLIGGTSMAGSSDPDAAQAPLSSLPLPVFNQRFNTMINTYWHAGFAPFDQAGISRSALAQSVQDDIVFDNTTAVVTDITPVFRTNKGWLVIVFVGSIILLLAGIACAVFDINTVGPDVAGFVNPLLVRSREMELPEGISPAMGGNERAMLLRNTRVMVQDAEPEQEVGRIILGTSRGGRGRLDGRRLYW